jgi:hypothetical protein
MSLKPQDILVCLKLAANYSLPWSYSSLSCSLELSLGEAHNAVQRLTAAKLYDETQRRPRLAALEEFLIHGAKYAFPAQRGGLTRGIPTAYAASPLKELLVENQQELPVWPHPEGATRGYEFKPLYATAPQAALNDVKLYELLALLDAFRDGGARERKLAEELLRERLKTTKAQE